MPRVSVCVPSYRSGADIRPTLASIRAQRYPDFQVLVAIEPTEQDTLAPEVRAEFEQDPRFLFFENPRVLGWAGNVAALIDRVDTEFFAVLPHDDMWHEGYLYDLLGALDAFPQASVAYADLRRFGSDTILRVSDFDNTTLARRLLSFFCQGAEAHAWRGVVRTACLAPGFRFPENQYLSFAVECEFMLHLLCQGAAVRVPRELYRKRGYPVTSNSVSSRWRSDLSPSEQCAAIRHHRNQMMGGIPSKILSQCEQEAIAAACEIAMWRRKLIFARCNPDIATQMRHEHSAVEGLLERVGAKERADLAPVIQEVARSIPTPADPKA